MDENLWAAWDALLESHGVNKDSGKCGIGKRVRWEMILKYIAQDLDEFLDLKKTDSSVKKMPKQKFVWIADDINEYLRNRFRIKDTTYKCAEYLTIKSDLFRMGAWVRASRYLSKITKSEPKRAWIIWALYYFGVGETAEAINTVVEEGCSIEDFDATDHFPKLKSQVVKSEEADIYYLHPDYNEFLDHSCCAASEQERIKKNEDAYFRREFLRIHVEGNLLPESAIHIMEPSCSLQEACQEYHRQNAANIRDSFNYGYCHEQEAYIKRYERYFLLRASSLTNTTNCDSYFLEVVSYMSEAFFWYDEYTDRGVLTKFLQALKNTSHQYPIFLDNLTDFITNYPRKELKIRKVGGQKKRWSNTYHALLQLKATLDAIEPNNDFEVSNKLLAQAFVTNYFAESLHFQTGRYTGNGETITGNMALEFYQEALDIVNALGEGFEWIGSFFLLELVQLHLYHRSFPEALRHSLNAYNSVEQYNEDEPEIRAWIFDLLGDIYYADKKYPEAARAWAVARYYALRFQHDQKAQGGDEDCPLPDSYTKAFLLRTLYNHLSLAHTHYSSSKTQEGRKLALNWITEIRRLLSDTPVEPERIVVALEQEKTKSNLNSLLLPAEVHQSDEALMHYAAGRSAVMEIEMTALYRGLIQRLQDVVAQYFEL